MADTDVAEFENRLLKRVLLIIENEWRSVLHRWIGTLRRSPCGQRFPQHKRIEDQARNVWLADSRIVRGAERPPPNATTDGNSIVHFRRSDVIVTGDIFNSTSYPFIDVRAGGSVRGEIAALNNILDKTVSWRQEGGTMIIPGHGRLSNEWEVTEYRDMMVIIRDRVQAMINKGATLQQVLAAKVSADYDARFGWNSGPWTTAMFIEALYTSLKE